MNAQQPEEIKARLFIKNAKTGQRASTAVAAVPFDRESCTASADDVMYDVRRLADCDANQSQCIFWLIHGAKCLIIAQLLRSSGKHLASSISLKAFQRN